MTTEVILIEPDFNALVATIVGLPVARAWRGHGSAVFLELGKLRAGTQRVSERARGPAGQFGEATIMIEWSWRVERRRSIQFGSFSSETRIDSGIASLVGPTVVAVSVVGRLPELVLSLSDGRWVHSFMTAGGQPVWTIFLPDASWLCVAHGHITHEVSNQRRRSVRASSA